MIGKMLIESLGVYLPPRIVSTDEILRGCRVNLRFPLERVTGIEYRHMAGDGEIVFRHGAPRGSHADHGYAATPEAAMRAFAKSWRRE